MEKSFFARIEEISRGKNSLLCIGLDPRPKSVDAVGIREIIARNRALIEATSPYAACYKPNMAFYERFGAGGLEALEETLDAIPDEIPVILDAKRCDIGATAEAYAESIFGHFHADAVTLSPYMGRDAAEPFLKFEGRGVFMLCRTSNPGAKVFQDLEVSGPRGPKPLYLAVARECSTWGREVGLVVAGNDPAALAAARREAPGAWFLAPGIGAQGGDMGRAVESGLRDDGLGILPVVARSIAESEDPGAAARAYRDKLNESISASRKKVYSSGAASGKGPDAASAGGHGTERKAPGITEVLKGLLETGCFKTGEFVLKSGKKSPFYIDLRRVISNPDFLSLVACAYASLFDKKEFDRIAGIPAAALPLATALSLETGIPMIWPRMPVKDHGTGNRVEGEFRKGERVLLVDDLITTGASKLEAVEILRNENLVVEDLVVLIERGAGGRQEMEAAGIRLRSFVHVSRLFAACEELGLIDKASREALEAFAMAE